MNDTVIKMNTIDFENILIELVYANDYTKFCEKLYSINLDTLTEEQQKNLLELFRVTQNKEEKEKNEAYITRQFAIRDIMEMDFATFQQCMKNQDMPVFVRANRNDKDFILFRDDNQERGWDRAYDHRSELLSTSYLDFISENVLPHDKYGEYIIRNIAMNEINNYTEVDFVKALQNHTIPTFVRAVQDDPDYTLILRDFSAEPGHSWLYWNRSRLLTTELNDFIELY